ncbi:MAG: hypothetical protein E7301_10995 [Butyrivibrio sp.]|nr:hypothetical protein [Butyrivibrio sp.]
MGIGINPIFEIHCFLNNIFELFGGSWWTTYFVLKKFALLCFAFHMKDVTSKLEELRGTLTEIEKRKTTGEYNLNASIEVEKKLKAVVDLDSFDSDTHKLILDRVLIKADGTEEYIWKDLGIV